MTTNRPRNHDDLETVAPGHSPVGTHPHQSLRRAATAPLDGPRLAVRAGRPPGCRSAGVRRRQVAQARPAARLEHRGHAEPRCSRRGAHRLLPRGDRLVPEGVSTPCRHARARGVARVRRRLHELGRLDQRLPPGETTLRIHQLRVRHHETRRTGRERDCRARGQFAPAQLPLVHGERHLSARVAGARRSAACGPLGRLRDDAARGLGQRGRGRAHAGRERPDRGTQGIIRSVVRDGAGRDVARAETSFSLPPGQRAALEQHLPALSPRLWSVATPNLYVLRSEVLVGGRTTDATTTPFGIRTIAYDKDRGFLLNGRRLKMKGVNLHHDGGAVGAAVPERIWERRLALLKAMGANAIRTSHNPPAPEFLDLCDRLGFLVVAEAFDEWTIGKVPEGYHRYFSEWGERDLTDFVHRDRNHPSIVLWSAGNEIGEQSTPEGPQVLSRLVGIFHREDPTRPVTTGNDNIAADGHPATLAFLGAEDVVGYNYVDRWHERREIFAEPDRHDHPDWKMIGTESGSVFPTFDERYSLGSDSEVVRPNYTTGMLQAERRWKWVAMRDYFAGDFLWTGIDYLGESIWPFKGFASGALDITGHPKDAYYLYQSLWTDQPVLHLFPHWNWTGRAGQVIPVVAYTNCNRVELFLNGS